MIKKTSMRVTRGAILSSLLLLLYMLFPTVASANLVALDSAVQGQHLGENMQILRDPGGEASLSDVIASRTWVESREAIPNLGNTSDVIWFHMEVQLGRQTDNWVLVLATTMLDYVDVYTLDADGKLLDHYTGGVRRPLAERALPHRYHVVPVVAGAEGKLDYYVRVKSFHSVQLDASFWPFEAFVTHDERETILTGVMLGAVFIMLVYNLFLYTTLRDSIYLAYVCSVSGFLMVQVCAKGYGYRFLWSDQMGLSAVAFFIAAFMTVFLAVTFAARFLQLQERGFRYMPVLEFSRWSALGLALMVTFIPDQWRLDLLVFLGVLAIVIGFIAIVTYYNTNDRPVQIFTLGWVVLLIGAMLFLLNKLGFVSVNIWTEQTMSLGTVIEVILFSMALGDRINNEKDQKLKAKQELLASLQSEREEQQRILQSEETARAARELTLQIQQDSNARLEQAIEARTAELQQATEELQRQVMLDPLTGAYNRHHFNEIIQEAFRSACEEQTELALVMIDIDHFKSINDRYGHLAGDRCLVGVASLLKELVEGDGSKLFRFGGEEFAVIMERTAIEQAARMAEHMCSSLAATVFADARGPRHVTISVGVASLWPRRHQRQELLVNQADEALYEAKRGGRNRVVVQQPEGGRGSA